MTASEFTLSGAQVTRLIRHWKTGDLDARDQVMELLYDSLRKQATEVLSNNSSETLSPAMLVNEVFIKLDHSSFDTPNRYAFRALVGRAMRNFLISYIREKQAGKRNHGGVTITLSQASNPAGAMSTEEFLDLSDALEELEAMDARCYRLCEGHYFAGMSYPELAEAEGVSEATVTRDLRFVRAFLKSKLKSGVPGEPV